MRFIKFVWQAECDPIFPVEQRPHFRIRELLNAQRQIERREAGARHDRLDSMVANAIFARDIASERAHAK
jgi:hypothetical protein